MIKKICMLLIFVFIYSVDVHAQEFKYVEIFDPKKDEIIKVVQLNSEINKLAQSYLNSIDGMYYKNDPATDDGYAVKIQLQSPVKVNKKNLNGVINEIFIVIPEKEQPFMMIFENENKLLPFPFKGDVNNLSRALDFKLK